VIDEILLDEADLEADSRGGASRSDFGHEHALDAAAQRGKAQRDDWGV
jgi:hypothetical protein